MPACVPSGCRLMEDDGDRNRNTTANNNNANRNRRYFFSVSFNELRDVVIAICMVYDGTDVLGEIRLF